MGPVARLICDQFIAEHDSCALRRHLDSVSLQTPIRDVVARCRVWESHADTEAKRRRSHWKLFFVVATHLGSTDVASKTSVHEIREDATTIAAGGADTESYSTSQVWNYWLGDFAAGTAARDSSDRAL